MSLFTQKMKMLTAVVLDGYSDAVVKALLEEGVMDFVHISQLDGEQASRLSSRKVDIPTGAIGDLRGRCENLMKLGGLDLPPISKSDVDSLGGLDMDACRRTLDGMSSGMAGLREEQRNLNQRLVAYDEILSYVKEKKTEYIDLRIGSISADRKLDDFMMRLAPYCAVVAKDDRGMLVSLSLKRDVSRIDEIMDKFHWAESSDAENQKGALLKAKAELAAEGMKVRVVSMPCMDVFEEQSDEYKESVLPKAVRKRVAIEALSGFGWGKYVGLDGGYVTMNGFGASGPAGKLFEKFGFTVENVVKTVKAL